MRIWHPIVACAALISVEAAFAPASPAQAAPLLFMSPNPIVALAAEDPPGSVPFGFELTLLDVVDGLPAGGDPGSFSDPPAPTDVSLVFQLDVPGSSVPADPALERTEDAGETAGRAGREHAARPSFHSAVRRAR